MSRVGNLKIFGYCNSTLFTYQTNTVRNLKTLIYGNMHLHSRNREVAGIQIGQKAMLCMFKLLSVQRLLQPPLTEQAYLNRNIHNSSQAWSDLRRKNQKKEEMKNYVFVTILIVVCLGMFLFSLTMRSHEDYVIVKPRRKE